MDSSEISLTPSWIFLCLFFGAALLCWALTFGVRWTALRLGVVAKRDSRRRHEKEVPLLGGTSIYLVICGVMLSLWLMPASWGLETPLQTRFVFCIIGALTLVYGIGLVDDFVELKAPPKFAAQASAALLVLLAEPTLPPIFHNMALPGWLATLALGLWLVGLMNAMNMIDGLDGLCAGIAGLSALTLAMIMVTMGHHAGPAPFLAWAVAGCCIGFLAHNYTPAKIFLGDSGSSLLGLILAIAGIEVEVKRSLLISLSLPIFLLGLPLLDIALSIIRRKRLEKSIFRGDRSHIHHRLQQIGLSHRAAVLLLWAASGYLNLMAFFLTQVPVTHTGFVYASIGSTIAFWLTSLYFVEKRLSYQNAQFSRLFLKPDENITANRAGLVEYIQKQLNRYDADGVPFTVILFDGSEVIKQIARERPSRVIEFYSKLYSILRNRLRDSDFVAQISEHRTVAILAGAGRADPAENAVLEQLRSRVRELEDGFHVFQGHAKNPEGFRVFMYPRDAAKLWTSLGKEAFDEEPKMKPLRAA